MTSNKSPFDAFFESISQSPEFQSLTAGDQSWENLEKNLKDIEASTTKANALMSDFHKEFSLSPSHTEPASDKKTGTPTDSEEITIEIKRFEKKDESTWGFAGVAGMQALKTELSESFIKPLRFKFLVEKLRAESEHTPDSTLEKLYAEYEKFRISIPTGMLLYGPPGTGKTFITKKFAEELECGFVSKNMGEFGSSYLHQTTKNIREFFIAVKKAAEHEPIILFLDEIDSLVSARTNSVDAHKAEEVSQFLQEFNALEEAKNLIVIAATNRPDHLDSAILRSGRLDKKIYL